jgi:hypothetical protein
MHKMSYKYQLYPTYTVADCHTNFRTYIKLTQVAKNHLSFATVFFQYFGTK